MVKENKRLIKFNNIRGEATFEEVMGVLKIIGYKLIRIKGSHFIFRNNKQEGITIPVHNNKIKKKYIKKIQDLIDKK